MSAAAELEGVIGARAACEVLEVSRSSYYRAKHPVRLRVRAVRPGSPRALQAEEHEAVLAALHSERFVDRSPAQAYATLLDEGLYLCSVRTMYRILAKATEVRERRNQCRHPRHGEPRLRARAPNQVWTWDLTKLRGPEKWSYYYLYVVLDLFSRYVVGWMLAHRESGELARRLIAQAVTQQRIVPGSLTVHADRGSAPTAKTLTQLYTELGIEPSLSRPRVSNDNPFSEAQFKTLKYAPGYPRRFGSFEDARGWCREFFCWYNAEHRHCGIAYLTPQAVHCGDGPAVLQARGRALARAYALHPERFVKGVPSPQTLPEEVWINPPDDRNTIEINSPSPEANLDSKPQLLVRGAH